MTILYADTGGATTNSGSSDNNSPDLSGSAASVATSVVTLDGSPSLAGVSTAGSTQAWIYLAQATNANQKAFPITAVDDTLKTVTVTGAPSGITSSNWAIGGRLVWTPANVEAAYRPGDATQFNNSPASRTTTFLTTRTSGDSASGATKFFGKPGTRPKLTITNTSAVLTVPTSVWWFENLELEQQGASGSVMTGSAGGNACRIINLKISDGGGNGITAFAGVIHACEITGVGGDGMNISYANGGLALGNYVHDIGGDAIEYSGAGGFVIVFNALDTATGRGVFVSGSTSSTNQMGVQVIQNTIYGCLNSGIEVTDADSIVNLFGNALKDNGDAAGEYNVEWAAGAAEYVSYHAYNALNTSGTGGSANASGITLLSNEPTGDPLFGNAAGGDFMPGSASPLKAASFPGALLGGTTGYVDIGAIQRQEPSTPPIGKLISFQRGTPF